MKLNLNTPIIFYPPLLTSCGFPRPNKAQTNGKLGNHIKKLVVQTHMCPKHKEFLMYLSPAQAGGRAQEYLIQRLRVLSNNSKLHTCLTISYNMAEFM